MRKTAAGSRLFLAAAALTATALLLPLWSVRMSAPQYPGESLYLRVTPDGVSGDVQEVQTLQKFIGVSFPTELDGLRWLRPVFVLLALLFAGAALLPGGRLNRALRGTVITLHLLLLAASFAFLQWQLYAVGHTRDPHAPIRGMKDFTPLALGPTHIGNFTVWSYPHWGGLALALAAVAALLGVRAARKTARLAAHAPPLKLAA